MITREDIRELARFHADGKQECALSFYFEPRTPQNKSHKEETILAKDLVKKAIREAEKQGRNGDARADLERILQIAEQLSARPSRAKAVFACGRRNFWREFDLPAFHGGTQLAVNRLFHLKPLAQILGAQPTVLVVLVDRHKTRFFDLRLNELTERVAFFRTPAAREGKSDGYAGYDGGHAQRRIEDEALHHYKDTAAHLQEAQEKGLYEKLIVGCHDVNWRDLEEQLHPYVKQRLLGRFSADIGKLTNDQVREHAVRIVSQALENRRREVVKQVLDQAKSNSRGVTGLRRVLKSLEMGEVQTLLIGDSFSRPAAQCSNCGHLDAHLVSQCPACGHATLEIEDVCDAIIPVAIQRDIELFYIKDDPEFDGAGNIAALLRFRADQNTNSALRAAS
jgi:peptide chain release factor subunit 1